nr:hypothetical protein [Streptomyces sp. 2231.1]
MVIAIEVPVFLAWLVQIGYLTGQELPRGDAGGGTKGQAGLMFSAWGPSGPG